MSYFVIYRSGLHKFKLGKECKYTEKVCVSVVNKNMSEVKKQTIKQK